LIERGEGTVKLPGKDGIGFSRAAGMGGRKMKKKGGGKKHDKTCTNRQTATAKTKVPTERKHRKQMRRV